MPVLGMFFFFLRSWIHRHCHCFDFNWIELERLFKDFKDNMTINNNNNNSNYLFAVLSGGKRKNEPVPTAVRGANPPPSSLVASWSPESLVLWPPLGLVSEEKDMQRLVEEAQVGISSDDLHSRGFTIQLLAGFFPTFESEKEGISVTIGLPVEDCRKLVTKAASFGIVSSDGMEDDSLSVSGASGSPDEKVASQSDEDKGMQPVPTMDDEKVASESAPNAVNFPSKKKTKIQRKRKNHFKKARPNGPHKKRKDDSSILGDDSSLQGNDDSSILGDDAASLNVDSLLQLPTSAPGANPPPVPSNSAEPDSRLRELLSRVPLSPGQRDALQEQGLSFEKLAGGGDITASAISTATGITLGVSDDLVKAAKEIAESNSRGIEDASKAQQLELNVRAHGERMERIMVYCKENIDGIDDFYATPPDTILQLVEKHVRSRDNLLSNSTKRGYLTDAYNALKTQDRLDEVGEKTLKAFNNIRKGYSKKERQDIATGVQEGHVPFTSVDSKHVAGYLLRPSRGPKEVLTYKQIQVMCIIVLGQATGRRSVELYTLCLGDSEIKVVDDGKGTKVYQMELWFAWTKGNGPGKYTQKIVSNSKLEKNPFFWLGLKICRDGVISDPMHFVTKPQEIELSKHYESVDVLYEKANDAKNEHENGITQRVQTKYDVDSFSSRIMDILRAREVEANIDVTSEDFRLPCWMCTGKFGGPTETRLRHGSFHDCISDFLCKKKRNPRNHLGYKSSNKNSIGVTNLRVSFLIDHNGVLDARGKESVGHREMHAGTTVLRERYETPNRFRRGMPANAFQEDSEEAAALFPKIAGTMACYLDKRHAVPGHEFYKGDLPTFEDAWKAEAKRELGRAPVKRELGTDPQHDYSRKFQFRCPVIGCNDTTTYRFYDDLMEKHMNAVHKVTESKWKNGEFVECPACDNTYTCGSFFNNHSNVNNSKCACKKIDELQFAKYPDPKKSEGQKIRNGAPPSIPAQLRKAPPPGPSPAPDAMATSSAGVPTDGRLIRNGAPPSIPAQLRKAPPPGPSPAPDAMATSSAGVPTDGRLIRNGAPPSIPAQLRKAPPPGPSPDSVQAPLEAGAPSAPNADPDTGFDHLTAKEIKRLGGTKPGAMDLFLVKKKKN